MSTPSRYNRRDFLKAAAPAGADLVQACPILYRQHITRDAPLRQIERGDMTRQKLAITDL
jgi:hypothetical protein